jgi:hypothetical protein
MVYMLLRASPLPVVVVPDVYVAPRLLVVPAKEALNDRELMQGCDRIPQDVARFTNVSSST